MSSMISLIRSVAWVILILLIQGIYSVQAGARMSSAMASVANPPNIVLMISDDQAYTDYGFMQHPVIRTPNLDRLAARSAVFRRGYVPTALCRPSLMTMITGLYPHQHGITGNDPAPDPTLSPDQYAMLREQLIAKVDQVPTLPRMLQRRGFLSHQSGKWWEGGYRRGGFTHGMTRGFPEPGGRHGDDGLQIGRQGMQPVLDFINQAVEADRPFFVWYAPFLPHTPHNPPPRILSRYQADDRPQELAKYFAMCEWFDETCGELLNHLDQKNLTDRTLVIFVCDNGWIQLTPQNRPEPEWRHAFAPRSKQSPYEGGTRTPIMYAWPGHIPPGDRPELASSIDIVPTILGALEMPVPDDLPGLNLMPLFQGTALSQRTELYGESFAHDVADVDDPAASLLYRWVIHDHWKLLLSYAGKPDRYADAHRFYNRGPQLFDLREDPEERSNLAAKFPERVGEMTERLLQVWHPGVRPIE